MYYRLPIFYILQLVYKHSFSRNNLLLHETFHLIDDVHSSQYYNKGSEKK